LNGDGQHNVCHAMSSDATLVFYLVIYE